MEILPDFLFDKTISFVKKIKKFNFWINQQEIKYAPDIIVLGIPGGIMPITEFSVNHFSEIALIISNSVVSDVGILTLYNGFHNTELNEKKLFKLCEFKYGIIIEHCVISNNYFRADYEEETVRYYKANKNSAANLCFDKQDICEIENMDGIAKQISDIIKQLEYNVFVI